MEEKLSKEEKQELKWREEIQEELEEIIENDTGSLVKLYSTLLIIGAILYSIVSFVLGIISLVSIESRFLYFWGGIIGLFFKGIVIIFLSLIARDFLLMFYEIHFLIKHKNS